MKEVNLYVTEEIDTPAVCFALQIDTTRRFILMNVNGETFPLSLHDAHRLANVLKRLCETAQPTKP